MSKKSEHKRKCWDCGNVAMHSDNIVPAVLCKQCGSQDTRLVREPTEKPADYETIESLRKDRDELRVRLTTLENMVSDAMSDGETVNSYRAIKAYQAYVSQWPMKVNGGK